MPLGSHPATHSCGNRKKDGENIQGKRESGGLSAPLADDLLGPQRPKD